MLRRHWRAGARELRMAAGRRAMVRACAEYVPALASATSRPGPAGVARAGRWGRYGALVDDFVIHDVGGAQFVRNAQSPAATSSLAIASVLAGRVERALG